MSYRVLSICEDPRLAAIVEASGKEAGYDLVTASSAKEGIRAAAEDPPDMILIEAGLPDIDGLACLRLLRGTREAARLPILLLAGRFSDDAMALAFDAGADDFLCYADLDPGELTARLRASARRRLEQGEHMGAQLKTGTIALDPSRHVCRVRGKERALRPREFELLEILMRKAGRVLSRSYLLESVWGMSRRADTRAVDVAVSRLRRALGKRAGGRIETVERFGYRLRANR